MIEVLPSINCPDKDFECVSHKLQVASGFADMVHLDVADGTFTFNKTWREVERWNEFATKLKLEVHLMVEHPERVAGDWFKAGAKRVVVHLETVTDQTLAEILAAAHFTSAEVLLAMGPETSIENLWTLAKHCDGFQVLSVHPGFAGQKFLPLSLDKLRFLHQTWPQSKIEADGSEDFEHAKLSKESGANIIVSATYIFENSDPAKAYANLKNL